MTIGREYYDKDGNYWQIETPYYIQLEIVSNRRRHI